MKNRNYVLLIFCAVLTAFLTLLKMNNNINWDWVGIFMPMIISFIVVIMDLTIRGIELYELRKRDKQNKNIKQF